MIGPLIPLDLNRDGKLDLAGADRQFGVVAFLNASQAQPAFTVVSAASLTGGPVAPDSLASAFGRNLSGATAAAGPGQPPIVLGGTTVSILDSSGFTISAPILYVSPLQVNFLVPPSVSAGPATVTIVSLNGTSMVAHSAQVGIAPVAPGIFTLNNTGLAAAYAVRVSSDGTQTFEPVYTTQNGALVANPIDLGSATDQVYLSLFGTGIRAAAGGVAVSIQGANVPVVYAGAQPEFAGLDQINVLLPHSLVGSGSVTIVVTANQIPANEVTLTIE